MGATGGSVTILTGASTPTSSGSLDMGTADGGTDGVSGYMKLSTGAGGSMATGDSGSVSRLLVGGARLAARSTGASRATAGT